MTTKRRSDLVNDAAPWAAGFLIGFIFVVILGCLGMLFGSSEETLAECYSYCESTMAAECRPAGWSVIKSNPCTCGFRR